MELEKSGEKKDKERNIIWSANDGGAIQKYTIRVCYKVVN